MQSNHRCPMCRSTLVSIQKTHNGMSYAICLDCRHEGLLDDFKTLVELPQRNVVLGFTSEQDFIDMTLPDDSIMLPQGVEVNVAPEFVASPVRDGEFWPIRKAILPAVVRDGLEIHPEREVLKTGLLQNKTCANPKCKSKGPHRGWFIKSPPGEPDFVFHCNSCHWHQWLQPKKDKPLSKRIKH